nr:disease resistance protein RPP4-like [Quercus suber]
MFGCENLIEVHEAIGSLDKLKHWTLSYCKKLQILPSTLRLKSLKDINLCDCVSLEKLPDLGAPNLEKLIMENCENLIEVHEAFGSLDKLKWCILRGCKKLQVLPSTLSLKSLEFISLCGCVSLEKFLNIHPEIKCGRLNFGDNNIREWLLSLKYLISGLTQLSLDNCQNVGDSLVSISGCKFTNLRELEVYNCDRHIIESHILMKLDSFPSLDYLRIDGSNIVTIPESIIRFTTLRKLTMRNCKILREIPRLPQSIRGVDASDCMSLDLPSSCRLFNQFLEIFLDPSSFCYDRYYDLVLPRIETPKSFKLNHQSAGNFQWFSKKHEAWLGFIISGVPEPLLLRPVYLGGWNESNPSEQNQVTITVEIERYVGIIPSSSGE